jgi:sugar lactone lactonase YvrE
MQAELVLEAQAELGEGPAWDEAEGLLYWVDIHVGRLHLFQPRTGNDRSIPIGEPLGCVAPCLRQGVVLGVRSGFARLDLGHLTLTHLANPEPDLTGNRFNDGKCDPAGRFLAGSMDDAEVEASGSLYSLAADGTWKTLRKGLRIPNGLAWSPDYRTFYHIDTPTRQVQAYDYDLERGEIAGPRTVLSVPPELGFPDGMTSDVDGILWIALWGGAQVTRWDPASGRMLEGIPLPALQPTSCVFGGLGMTDLYITTARIRLSAGQLKRYPLSGGLFRVQTSVQGLPTFRFGG